MKSSFDRAYEMKRFLDNFKEFTVHFEPMVSNFDYSLLIKTPVGYRSYHGEYPTKPVDYVDDFILQSDGDFILIILREFNVDYKFRNQTFNGNITKMGVVNDLTSFISDVNKLWEDGKKHVKQIRKLMELEGVDIEKETYIVGDKLDKIKELESYDLNLLKVALESKEESVA